MKESLLFISLLPMWTVAFVPTPAIPSPTTLRMATTNGNDEALQARRGFLNQLMGYGFATVLVGNNHEAFAAESTSGTLDYKAVARDINYLIKHPSS